MEGILAYPRKQIYQILGRIATKNEFTLVCQLVAFSPLLSGWRSQYFEYPVDLVELAGSGEDGLVRVELAHEAAGSEDVGGAGVMVRPEGYFGGAVPARRDVGGVRAAVFCQVLASAEVDDSGEQGPLVYHDVVGLDVAVHDAEVLV